MNDAGTAATARAMGGLSSRQERQSHDHPSSAEVELGRNEPDPCGLPIILSGHYVGGVGVSGGTGEQDAEVAQAGIAALSVAG